MASDFEPVAVASQKRDGAWKHCEMFKNGNRVQLKCVYCGKIFKGGGIHRIKEHLAGQKGNGATCLKVQPDVRIQMLESLDGFAGKKRKKNKPSEEISGYENPGTSGIKELRNHSGRKAEIKMLPVPEMLEENVDGRTNRKHGMSNKAGGRKKKGIFRRTREVASTDIVALTDFQSMTSRKNVDAYEAASDWEPVALTSQKRDQAWKHCQMLKNGDKVQLKCTYCGKVFKGGGIYRIKEHLAGKKGNGATCLKVQPDVQFQMLESLNEVVGGKHKKQKASEQILDYDNPGISELELLNNHCGLNTEINLLPMLEMLEENADGYVSREDGVSNIVDRRKNKETVREVCDVGALSSFQTMNSNKLSHAVHMAIGRFFFHVGLPLHAVNSLYFQPMIDAIASQGDGVSGPSCHDLRSWILKNLVHEVRNDVGDCTRAWGRTGCSILVNEWNSGKGKILVSFLVYCPEGTIFLRFSDVSHIIESADALYALLREIVEEVGMRNVLQVVTNTEDRYIIAGKRLTDAYPTVFWTPCAGYCIDLMLKDIGELPRVKMILAKAKSVSRYIYSNNILLNMMRRFTCGVDLVDIGITRSSTDFMTLKRMVNIRYNLQSMVTSNEWMESPYSKKSEGFATLHYLSNESFWVECATIMRLTDPLLRLLRIVGCEKRPAMGFVYAGVYRSKETIKRELVNKEEYLVYWNIIDRRWNQLQHHPLHAAGFYFNPKFFYSLEGDAQLQIRSLVYDCIEKLVPDPKIQDKIMKEITSYHGGMGDFGRKMAIRARETLLPTDWWLTFGGGCPNLTRLAISILSQTSSLLQYKPNKVPLERVLEKKNCLEHHRLSDLIFVQHNMSLKQMVPWNKQQKAVDPISYEYIDIVEDWVMEKEFCSEGLGNIDWMAVDPLLGDVTRLDPTIDDVAALGAGFDDYEIFNGLKDNEGDNGDENIGSQKSFPFSQLDEEQKPCIGPILEHR